MKVFNKNSNVLVVVAFGLLIGIAFLVSSLVFKNNLDVSKEPSSITVFTSCLMYPLLKIQQALVAPFQKKISYHTSHEQLYKKALAIQEENDSLKAENLALKATAVFADKTKEIIEYQSRYSTDYAKLTQVIMKHRSADEHSLLVDSGSNQGVEVGMAVICKNNLIGKVTQIYPCYSKVLLITDERCPVSCYCLDTKTEGIFQGNNSIDTAHLLHVDRLHELKIGDVLVSSGEGLIFPQGFLLGKISSFEPDGIHFLVKIEPIIDLYSIDYCYIIQKGQACPDLPDEQTVASVL